MLGSFAWAPDEGFVDAFADTDIPADVRAMLSLGGERGGERGRGRRAPQCNGRSTGWLVHAPSGVPYRLTVVAPGGRSGARGVTARAMSAASSAFVKILDDVDSSAVAGAPGGFERPAPSRPSSIDAVVLLWGAAKKVPPPGQPVEPRHANTGMCVRKPGGSALILVYRREEAVKTLAHEILHAYRVGDWCNGDAWVQRGCASIADACLGRAGGGGDARLPRPFKPTEALVEFMAVQTCLRAFGGATEAGVLRHARAAARRLASHFDTVRPYGALQTTAAFEYYVVHLHLLALSADVNAAHARGLQRPDKQAVRRAFLTPHPCAAYFAPGSLPARPAGRSLRRTPASLAPALQA